MEKKRVTYRKIGKNDSDSELHLNKYRVKIDGFKHFFKNSRQAKLLYNKAKSRNEQKGSTNE